MVSPFAEHELLFKAYKTTVKELLISIIVILNYPGCQQFSTFITGNWLLTKSSKNENTSPSPVNSSDFQLHSEC